MKAVLALASIAQFALAASSSHAFDVHLGILLIPGTMDEHGSCQAAADTNAIFERRLLQIDPQDEGSGLYGEARTSVQAADGSSVEVQLYYDAGQPDKPRRDMFVAHNGLALGGSSASWSGEMSDLSTTAVKWYDANNCLTISAFWTSEPI